MLKLHESEQNWDGGKAGRKASCAARVPHVCLSVSVCLSDVFHGHREQAQGEGRTSDKGHFTCALP